MYEKVMLLLLVTSLCSFLAATGQAKDCNSPPVSGPCKLLALSYYYDPDSRKCKTFVFGGCYGNGNQYRTEADCFAACSGTSYS
ncbi:proteinase inhibitor-like [Tachypleus tridentatus]|uniref:proteinase inhibitor-like n=1 Tax=Tachypleus tridentatus TaxID=6853 RepID=UPI003FD14B65